MGDTSFNKLPNINAMPNISRQLILFTTLLFALSTLAAQGDKREVRGNLVPPSEIRNFPSTELRQFEVDGHGNRDARFNELEGSQRSNRYGIGYEMRQGGRSSAQGTRGRGR